METKILSLMALLVVSAVTTYTAANAESENNGTSSLQPESNITTLTTGDSNTNGSTATVATTKGSTTAVNTTVTLTSTNAPTTTTLNTVTNATTTGYTTPNTTAPTTEAPPTATGTTEFSNGTTYSPTQEPSPCPSRSFDAASFIGGIVLGLGVCAISFFAYKWYQSRHSTGSPYHQF